MKPGCMRTLSLAERVALGDIIRTARVSYQEDRHKILVATGHDTSESANLLAYDEQARLFLEELEGE